MTLLTDVQQTKAIEQDRRRIEVPEEIFYEVNDASPIVLISRMLSRRVVGNPEYKMFEKTSLPEWTAIDNVAGYDAAATDIIVDTGTGAYFKAGDLVKVVRTMEVLLVTAIVTDTLTVLRGFGTTTAAAMLDNDVLHRFSHLAAEYGSDPAIKLQKITKRTNYTQIFKEPFGASRTLKKSNMVGPPVMQDWAKSQLIEMKKKIELSFLFGEPKEDVSEFDAGGYPTRETGGLYYWIGDVAGNVTTDAALTQTDFETFARNAFGKVYDSDGQIFLFCSPIIISAINFWSNDKLRLTPSAEMFGLKIGHWTTGHGDWTIVRHPLLVDPPAGTGDGVGYSGMAFSVPASILDYVVFQDDDVHVLQGRAANDKDGDIDMYLGELGLGCRLPQKAWILKGVTSYS